MTVLRTQLRTRLLDTFLQSLAQGVEISYAAIPQITRLAEPMRDAVRVAFAHSRAVLWEVMIAIAGLSFLSIRSMREVGLQQTRDENWGLGEEASGGGTAAIVLKSEETTV